MKKKNNSLFDKQLVNTSLVEAFRKLDPRTMIKNPIMFTVELVTAIMLLMLFYIAFTGDQSQGSFGYNLAIFFVLLLTILFANFAEAIAEARGKAQADSLRKTREETPAKRIDPDGQSHIVSSSDLRQGDLFECVAGDTVAADGEIVEGLASIDESAITGESAPVIREAGGDKSSVTGGTKVLSDRIVVKVTAKPGESFLDKMIALVEGSSRQKTPNEIALTILLAGFTLVFVIVCATLKPFADYVGANITVAAFISLFVCLIPTTIGGLLSAIGIAGMDRALRANVITKSGKAVETAGDLDTLLLDKTGTITEGRPVVTDLVWLPGQEPLPAVFHSLEKHSEHPLADAVCRYLNTEVLPVTSFESLTGKGVMGIIDGVLYRAGNKNLLLEANISIDPFLQKQADELAQASKTVIWLADSKQALAVAAITDRIKPTSINAIHTLQEMGIQVWMLTGDQATTAKAIAEQVGIRHYQAGMTPQGKAGFVKQLQQEGKQVAMIGDGINDSAALAQSDLSIAMGQGSDIAIDVAQMTIISSDLQKIPEAIQLSRLTVQTIRQNLFWAFIYNLIAIPVAAGILYPINGFLLNPMIAGAAMAMSSVSVVSNSLRLKRKKIQTNDSINTNSTTMKKEYVIEGMMCNHCRMRAEKSLNQLEGVQASVSLNPPVATIEFTEGEKTLDELQAVLTDDGYTIHEK